MNKVVFTLIFVLIVSLAESSNFSFDSSDVSKTDICKFVFRGSQYYENRLLKRVQAMNESYRKAITFNMKESYEGKHSIFSQETEENPYTGNYNGIAFINTLNYTFMYDYMSTAYTYYTSQVDKSYEGGAMLASSQHSLAVLMNKYYYSAGIVLELQSNYNSKTTTDKMPGNEVSAINNRHREVGDFLKENKYALGYHVNGGVICNVPKLETAFFISNNSLYVSNKTARASTKYRENSKFSSFDLDFNELLASISKFKPEKSVFKVETNSYFSDSYFQNYEYTLLQPSINIAIGDNSTRFDFRANLRYNIDKNKLFSHEYIVGFAYQHTVFAFEYTNINNYYFTPVSNGIYSKSMRFLFGFQYVDILSSDVLDVLGL